VETAETAEMGYSYYFGHWNNITDVVYCLMWQPHYSGLFGVDHV
jgi:hypothetical protein